MTGIVTQGTVSRRATLRAGVASVAATLGAAAIEPRLLAQEATPVAAQDRGPAGAQDGLSQEVVEAFKGIPGQQALKLWAPADAGRPEWSAALNPGSQLFIGSVFKGLALAECLRLEEEALDPRGETPLAAQLDARLAQPLTLAEVRRRGRRGAARPAWRARRSPCGVRAGGHCVPAPGPSGRSSMPPVRGTPPGRGSAPDDKRGSPPGRGGRSGSSRFPRRRRPG